jgi:hypothetical protein
VARETGCAENWVHQGYGEEVHLNLGLSLTPSWIDGLDAFKNFLSSHGFLAGDFDVAKWIDPAPLRDVMEQLRRTSTASLWHAANHAGSPAAPRMVH